MRDAIKLAAYKAPYRAGHYTMQDIQIKISDVIKAL